ncbi:hypothetical protein E1262_06055 [Jiangella aurantiaca]|uniref:DUF559 domain-containing protein n=1 Tax=Jiangella aurantiaca TaxID=2530373 RepID=A0A4R5AGW8_9ACTN|nr:hypothetical protein [Jiangella aurantiaca]TDD71691.1 hypothetical protein E1262_06055 [Jiangella aurantiaca]
MRYRRYGPGRRTQPVPERLAGAGFTYGAARAAGVTKDRLCGPGYVRLHRGVYAERELDVDGDRRVRAWLLALPADAALYGATAAAWFGLPVAPPADVQVIVPPGTVPRRRPGLEPHEGLGLDDVTVHRGLRVTTPERTWLDLSLTLGDVELVVVGDAMVRRGLTTCDRLVESADVARRRRGIVRARSLARLVRDRVDSPQETRLRLVLVAGNLPEPAVNPDLSDERGGWIGRPDLAYADVRLAIQYEGDVHRTNAERWRADVGRDEVLRDHGWEVVRVTAADIAHPAQLCARIRRALDRQRRRLG